MQVCIHWSTSFNTIFNASVDFHILGLAHMTHKLPLLYHLTYLSNTLYPLVSVIVILSLLSNNFSKVGIGTMSCVFHRVFTLFGMSLKPVIILPKSHCVFLHFASSFLNSFMMFLRFIYSSNLIDFSSNCSVLIA